MTFKIYNSYPIPLLSGSADPEGIVDTDAVAPGTVWLEDSDVVCVLETDAAAFSPSSFGADVVEYFFTESRLLLRLGECLSAEKQMFK